MEDMLVSGPLNLPTFNFREDESSHCNSGKVVFLGRTLSARENRLVCVTSSNSILGSSLVRELLAHGYLVRVTIQNQVDFEDMEKLLRDEEISKLEGIVVVKMQDVGSLCEAFRGCHAIFHTSSFIDPHGVSGYSEAMAFLETEAANNVIEACGKAAYVRRCIFTSSLLSSIWITDDIDRVINENCWSNEEFCRRNKLWLALGKTRAEKAAWEKSKQWKVNLLTLCPGLLLDPSFPYPHKKTSVPYLKGGSIMLKRGVLATTNLRKLVEAQVSAYKAMDYGASGRYLCFDKVVLRLDEAIQLQKEVEVQGVFSERGVLPEDLESKLTNSKLTTMLAQASERATCKE